MTISERIKLVRGKISQESFGEKVGVSQSAVQLYEKGHIPKGDVLKRISETFGVSVDWLLFGDEPPSSSKHRFSGETGEIYLAGKSAEKEIEGESFKITEYTPENVVGPEAPMPSYLTEAEPREEAHARVAAIETELSSEDGQMVFKQGSHAPYAFRKDWLHRVGTRPGNLVLMTIQGDSMFPTLQAGDLVMVDRGRQAIRSGYLYAYSSGDDLIHIKRLEPRGDRILIISDNTSMYPAYEADRTAVRVIGQVVWYARELVRGEPTRRE